MASIHETALKTVARISFTLGALGCIEDGTDPLDPSDPDVDAGADDAVDGAAHEADVAFVEVPDGALPDVVLVFPDDAGVAADGDFLADAAGGEIDAEPDMSPEVTADAGTTDAGEPPCAHLTDPEDWEEREKCCAEIGWDFEIDPSCTPWGPPVPPAMPGVKS